MGLASLVGRGDRRAMARLIRSIDDRAAGYLDELREIHRLGGNATVIGVTGAPGSGKSTLTDWLITSYRSAGKTVGVVAVDPSSPFTGGAILGDRIRMGRHALDPGVFIRSLATRGHLGGLSRSAVDVACVLDAAGFDVVIMETVGVGQDEVDIARWAHTTILVVVPESGDHVQTLKAGIMEVADLFAVNKADRPGADRAAREIEATLRLPGTAGSGWTPPVVLTVGTTGDGVPQLVDAVRAHGEHLAESGEKVARLGRRARELILSVMRDTLVENVRESLSQELEEAAGRVLERTSDPYTEAARLAASLGGR